MKTSEISSIESLIPKTRGDKSPAAFVKLSAKEAEALLAQRTVGQIASDRFLLDAGKYSYISHETFADNHNGKVSAMTIITLKKGNEEYYTTLGALTKRNADNKSHCPAFNDEALIISHIKKDGINVASVETDKVWDWAAYRKAGNPAGGPAANGIAKLDSKFIKWS
jgi:hypothetical protein